LSKTGDWRIEDERTFEHNCIELASYGDNKPTEAEGDVRDEPDIPQSLTSEESALFWELVENASFTEDQVALLQDAVKLDLTTPQRFTTSEWLKSILNSTSVVPTSWGLN